MNIDGVETGIVNFEHILKTKCFLCKINKPVVLVIQYSYEEDDLSYSPLCKECFRKDFPEYTLENKCIVCKKSFKCNTQSSIFSKKEIEDFRREFYKKNKKN